MTTALFLLTLLILLPSSINALGGASTLAISHATGTVCGVLAAASPLSVLCSSGNRTFPVVPNAAFSSISGGQDFLCGLRSNDPLSSLFCWSPTSLKRIYHGANSLEGVSVGKDHVAALERGTAVKFWRVGAGFPRDGAVGTYWSLTSGDGFSCAIEVGRSGRVRCWGDDGRMEGEFRNESMTTLTAGDHHLCGFRKDGFLICKGKNESGQLGSNVFTEAYEYSVLALGRSHTCAIKRENGTVVCWGGGGESYIPTGDISFEVIVAGGDLSCGITSRDLSVVCWGLQRSHPITLTLPPILPGFCTNGSGCSCGVFPDSNRLCSGSGVICNRCNSWDSETPPPHLPPAQPAVMVVSKRSNRGFLVFAIVGSVGAFAGICSILFCLWNGICRQKKVHNSVQPTIAAAATNGASHGNSPPLSTFSSLSKSMRSRSRSLTFRRQGSWALRRQRSGPSSSRRERNEEFTFDELVEATNHFSLENKIGAGSFGTVYHGKLPDGREVAIKRSETGPRASRFQEKESAFQSELAFLSRVHHKHLVSLIGSCEVRDERLLVYEYMKNGALYDHLHSKEPKEGVLNSWKIRIKILLDAARGIEYLHNYAVPPIIHRDIKSSNILLDSNWVARVSDFGLSLSGPETDGAHLSMKAAGTVGYMDPEYYGLHHLTVKSDIYGFGVVMLEVLTGRRAVFKEGEGEPMSIVDYAVVRISAGDVRAVLDVRVAAPGASEAEAVERVANTAVQCVRMEGKDRPTITDVVANLECAMSFFDGSNGSISSSSITSARE